MTRAPHHFPLGDLLDVYYVNYYLVSVSYGHFTYVSTVGVTLLQMSVPPLCRHSSCYFGEAVLLPVTSSFINKGTEVGSLPLNS